MADVLQILQDIRLTTWLALVLGLLVFVYWRGVYRYYSILGGSTIPGPKPWPWVGNLPDVFKYGGLHKLYLNYFYKYGRVYSFCIGRSPTIVVADPEIVKQIMVKEFWKFTNRPVFIKPNPPLNSALFLSRDDTWRRMRHILSPTFTAAKLKHIVPIIDEASDKLLSKMQTFFETGKLFQPAFSPCHYVTLCLYEARPT